VWDVDGREYIDFVSTGGPILFGHGNPHIEAAAARQRALGDTMNCPAPVLVELAEAFVKMVSHADWALFAKNGVDAINAAVLLARAHTGKRRVLVAANSYHGAAPWCTPVTVGVLPEARMHRVTFEFNDTDTLNAAVAEAPDDLAAILVPGCMPLMKDQLPLPDFAKRCRELCDSTGALLIVDDIRAGLRFSRDCSWSLVNVKPDLSCWSKSIANGYPISAVLGSEKVREAGRGVLIAGTFWIQAVPMAASLATLELVRDTQYLEHAIALGTVLRTGLDDAATRSGFRLNQSGPVQMPWLALDDDPDLRMIDAFTSAMFRRGIFLHPFHNEFISAAMTSDDIAQTIEAANSAFAELSGQRESIKPNAAILAKLGKIHGSKVTTKASQR
jgi:glutamate-1-semialdehyde 2,1-aminomutase